ncbi:hypothetical protein FHT44_006298 [Mycolicibacterium sp. BK634]|uniref:hypothetical protein n=1 Tax=Mycolicibacterium sp. BK634 TaxID=2587099 RepID=UPI00160AE7A0|nr:hypothetical protein [Mycolicibacterium sp. BK634]MBB3753776.1 hypothetical protein [Mycolicibacterium sp. BK634]
MTALLPGDRSTRSTKFSSAGFRVPYALMGALFVLCSLTPDHLRVRRDCYAQGL